MIRPEWYSTAPRCGPCGQRAILSRRAAERLAAAASGGLVVFVCAQQRHDWHVRAPDVEFTRRHARK